MSFVGGGLWVPTERTHPFYLVQVLGMQPVLVIAQWYLWTAILLPEYGIGPAVVTVVATAAAVLLLDLWTWRLFRPTAVRTMSSGIDIRLGNGRVVTVPGDKVVLRARSPEGFGFVAATTGMAYFLSPNQFSAAKAFFPVEGTRSPAKTGTLP